MNCKECGATNVSKESICKFNEGKCKKIYVPLDVCYISFSKKSKKVLRSHVFFQTCRNEEMVVDYDVSGKLTGIELVNTKLKGCQRSVKK